MDKRTICQAHSEAQEWYEHFLAEDNSTEFIVVRLMNIIEEMREMGARMENRLKEYYDFMSEWMEAADDLMED